MIGATTQTSQPYFTYFPDNYRWSLALLIALGGAASGGAELGEVHRIAQRLSGPSDDRGWFEAWVEAGDRLQRRSQELEEQGRLLTAGSAALRACNYYQIGERFVVGKDAEALDVYRKSVDCFETFAKFRAPQIETVRVPYEDTYLPAYLVPPTQGSDSKPFPCVVFFDGLDITKELQYLRGVTELSDRGIGCLIVDGPGNGEAIRFLDQPLRHDYEVAGTACLDYLISRGDTDPARIAVMGISLGGYFAPRCAAFEPRFAACVALGAIWDYRRMWIERRNAEFDIPMSVAGEHISWALGVETVDAALQALELWDLESVVGQISAPLLVLHGVDDQQVPLEDARMLVDRAGSADKTLRIYESDAAGSQHCQVDHPIDAMQDIGDWLASRFDL